ncbi:quinone oxidoreductase PIG3-like isoform X2 [Mytilus galloprovincialis]|uniref:quinone oxidoreductase PIG3-like isoform X2 n=1 Tax=Mytilus galloprovincialis TaxID=29158 RepID=UPI003F7C4FA4
MVFRLNVPCKTICRYRRMLSQMAGTMRAVQFQTGGPEKMKIGEVPIPDLRKKEILIKVYASAINRADTLQRKGAYPPPAGESDILGLEAVGTVDKLGPDCSQKWKIGDRVMALLAGGGNAEFVACREECLIPIPKKMSFTTAAAIPEVWLTAYQLLHTVGGVKSGDSVLIHAGGSGVGTAATQLSILANAKPIITAGSTEKINMAKSLGAVAGFNYKEGDFSVGVKQHTKDAGVNLILDCIGESFYNQNIESIANDGTWVVYGLLGGGKINADLLSKLLRKRITITGTTLRVRPIEYKESLVQNFTQNALPYFESGKLKPIIDKIFPLEQIGNAHQLMEENKNTGKIVLKVREEAGKDEL